MSNVHPAPATGLFRSLLWPTVRPYRWWLLLAIGLNAGHGLAITYQNLLPKYLIDDVIKPGPDGLWTRLTWLIGTYLLVSVVGRMIQWHLSMRIFTWVRERAMQDLRARFFGHVNRLCLRFHGSNESGELFNYLFGSPISKLQSFLSHVTLLLPGAVIAFVTTIVAVGLWDLWMTAVLLLSILLSVWAMTAAERRVHDLWAEYQKTEGKVSAVVADLLRGNRAVRLHAMEEHVQGRFRAEVDRIREQVYRVDVRSHIEWMKQEGIGYACFALLCAVGAWRYVGGHISDGMLVTYITTFFALQWPLQTVFQAMTMRGGARAALERIDAVLRTPSTTPDPPGTAETVPARAAIRLEGVRFAYGAEEVIAGVDLDIPYGQRIALVGPSGSGKSTLSSLALRLVDPTAGRVLLGGTDLRRLRGAELRRRWGVVPQDPFIFRTTIRENVRVSLPEADDTQVRRALELANAWEFVAQLPQGLDSVVGEGGCTLSGGQRQRVAIARALLADPDWFVFDEATSALDSLSERLIQDAVERNLGGRTAIFIAHRLATVRNCDRIIVVQGGRIVQDGTYAVLAESDGLFRDLVRRQELFAAGIGEKPA
jgi:ABC-type multidrug transport system fused ATPase/permease subunit